MTESSSVSGPKLATAAAVCEPACESLPASAQRCRIEAPAGRAESAGAVTFRRQVRQALGARSAATAIGPIRPGCELVAVTDGGVSLIDCLAYALDSTGPADVWLATWTIGAREVSEAYRLLSHGAIRSLRLIVDASFPARQPAYCAALRARFGDDAIRLVRSHVKAAVLLAGEWRLVIRGSANLNENRRLELLEVSDCPILAEYLRSVFAAIFTDQPAGPSRGRGQTSREFDGLIAALAPAQVFGDGPLDSDVRRAGWTFARTGQGLTR